MKTRIIFLIACLLALPIFLQAKNYVIKGNGKIITQVIPISDYNTVQTIGSGEIEYKQLHKAPYLEIRVDENILPYLDISVTGKTLEVKYKNMHERNSSFNITPTVFTIQTNSSELKELNAAGSGSFVVASPLDVSKLVINLAGSGNVIFDQTLQGNKGEFNLAGSGNIMIKNTQLRTIDCNLAGSGEIQIKGKADRASYSVASSGEIKAFSCEAKKVECSVAGSGTIDLHATEQLDANIISSGEIRYKGNPVLSSNNIGSGSIKKIQ